MKKWMRHGRIVPLVCCALFASVVYGKLSRLGIGPESAKVARLQSPCNSQDVGVVPAGAELNVPFIIANVGAKRLVINQIVPGCDCGSETLEGVCLVPPGEQRKVMVRFNPGFESGRFTHEASYSTNDPNNHRIVLTVEGIVDTHSGLE